MTTRTASGAETAVAPRPSCGSGTADTVDPAPEPPPDAAGGRAAPDEPSDAAIVARSLETPTQFSALFDRHAPAIHRYLARRAGAQVADDLVGANFLVAFERRAAYDLHHPDARPWLYGIASNLLGRHRRDEQRTTCLHACRCRQRRRRRRGPGCRAR